MFSVLANIITFATRYNIGAANPKIVQSPELTASFLTHI